MLDIWNALKSAQKPILIYGTGNGADKIIDELEKNNISINGVFASDGFVRERYFHNMKVLSFYQAEEIFDDFIVLFAFGSNRPEVINNIKEISKKHEILAPDVPVCDGDIFNLSFAKKHSDELRKVYDLLNDNLSKKVFEETTLFKLDGKIDRLFSCETDPDETFSNILRLNDSAAFLDLGAYNGDTVIDFATRFPYYSQIIALEPDIKNYKKLVNNTACYNNVVCINSAVSDSDGFIGFSNNNSRSSKFGGDKLIPSISIDSLSQKYNFDFINIDVEGLEYKTILGGKNTITEKKPKMLVSCYHKSEDYFKLPLKILEFNPNYKIYMRHFPYVPAWDTAFYFV